MKGFYHLEVAANQFLHSGMRNGEDIDFLWNKRRHFGHLEVINRETFGRLNHDHDDDKSQNHSNQNDYLPIKGL